MRLPDAVVRRAWTLERFGLTPGKLVARVANRREPKILCVSLPKAGTHLLERALCLHPRLYRRILPTLHDNNIGRWGGLEALLGRLRPGQLLVSHLHFRPEYPRLLREHGVRCLFLIRDPRDILVSQAFYIVGDPRHYLHSLFAALPDLPARLRVGITGDTTHGLLSFRDRLAAFAGWLDASDLVVRYEQMIGGAGGAEQQRSTLRSVYEASGLPLDDAALNALLPRLVSRASPTFRRGSTGEWTKHLGPELVALLESGAGAELERYGYGAAPAA